MPLSNPQAARAAARPRPAPSPCAASVHSAGAFQKRHQQSEPSRLSLSLRSLRPLSQCAIVRQWVLPPRGPALPLEPRLGHADCAHNRDVIGLPATGALRSLEGGTAHQAVGACRRSVPPERAAALCQIAALEARVGPGPHRAEPAGVLPPALLERALGRSKHACVRAAVGCGMWDV